MTINNSIFAPNTAEQLNATRFERIVKRIIVNFIFILFVANQFPHTTTFKEISFYGSLFLFLVLLCTQRVSIKIDSPLIPPALAFIIIATIGSFWALNRENTLHDIYAHLLRYVILWVIMTSVLEKRRNVELLITLIIASTTIFCLHSIVDLYVVKKLSIYTRLLTGAQEITTNLLGIHTILAINLAIYKLKSLKNGMVKIGFSLAIIILLLASFATQTRSTLGAIVLSILIIFVVNQKWLKLIVILAVIGLIAVFSPEGKRLSNVNMTSNIRIQQIFLCLEVLKDHPLTGIGFGMQTFGQDLDLAAYNKRVKAKYPLKKFPDSKLTNPHNLYTDIAVRTGVIGFFTFMVLIFTAYRLLLKTILAREKYYSDLALVNMASLSSFLFIAFFEPVFSHPFEVTLCLIFALVQLTYKKATAKKHRAYNSPPQEEGGKANGI